MAPASLPEEETAYWAHQLDVTCNSWRPALLTIGSCYFLVVHTCYEFGRLGGREG
jgi:hypothetical protein